MTDPKHETMLRALQAQRTEALNAAAAAEASAAQMQIELAAAARANALLQSQLDDAHAQLASAGVAIA
jgi:acetolactate synthase regulatory subunit